MTHKNSVSRRDFFRKTGVMAGAVALASSPLFALALNLEEAPLSSASIDSPINQRADIRSMAFDSHQFQWNYRNALHHDRAWLI